MTRDEIQGMINALGEEIEELKCMLENGKYYDECDECGESDYASLESIGKDLVGAYSALVDGGMAAEHAYEIVKVMADNMTFPGMV